MDLVKEIKKGFQSSCGVTNEWKSFYRRACNLFKKELFDTVDNIQMSRGHFYFRGFFTDKVSKQIFYFSISDVRYFPSTGLLIRTATSYKEYTGGRNQMIPINNNLFDTIKMFVKN